MKPLTDPTGLALEQTIVENPADLAAHRAFADWLSEQADPHVQTRGEFAQVQLQLEDRAVKGKDRKRLEGRQAELIQKHEVCLIDDELAQVFQQSGDVCKRDYVRGWLNRLCIEELSIPLANVLSQSPSLRLLRELETNAMDGREILAILARCPYLGNVREFDANIYEHMIDVESLVARIPNLEKLYLVGADLDPTATVRLSLPHLESLTIVDATVMPVRDIAANKTFKRLTTLQLKPGPVLAGSDATIGFEDLRAIVESPHLRSVRYLTLTRHAIGDEGIRLLINSKLIDRLTFLELSYGDVTDRGARLLAKCRGAAKLYKFDLNYNRLSSTGVELLQEKLDSVTLLHIGEQQLADDDDDYNDSYLYADEDSFDSDWE